MVEGVRKSLGLVHVYTGNGKGKTTAALGLALRALEHGLTVDMVQFLKGGSYTGELSVPLRYEGRFRITQHGKGNVQEPRFEDFSADELDRARAQDALEQAQGVLARGTDVLILDEVHVAVALGHLAVEELMSFLARRPRNVEIVLTGRGAHERVLEVADYVTEMKACKHPYSKGVLGRAGIDF